jgi:anti-sigma regulatory factor (Ser/Thr protein kinase)
LTFDPEREGYERRYASRGESVRRAARDLCAFLLECDVAPSHRMRIASAAAELVENVCRHAYPAGDGKGPVLVRAAHDDRHVEVEIEDHGQGLAASRCTSGAPSWERGGLARAEALCERLALESDQRGTRVTLDFDLIPTRFEEEHDDLSEADFLDPETTRRLVASLSRGSGPTLPSALIPTVGRLIAGAKPRSEPRG